MRQRIYKTMVKYDWFVPNWKYRNFSTNNFNLQKGQFCLSSLWIVYINLSSIVLSFKIPYLYFFIFNIYFSTLYLYWVKGSHFNSINLLPIWHAPFKILPYPPFFALLIWNNTKKVIPTNIKLTAKPIWFSFIM